MPRVHTVKKCRKNQGPCNKCGKKIKKGDGYRWWQFAYSGKSKRCMNCPYPRASELTQSDKLSRIYAVQEDVGDATQAFRDGGEIDDLRSACEDAASTLQEVAEEYRESANNIRDSFTESSTADECDEKADNVESAAGEFEGIDFEEFDEEGAREELKDNEKVKEEDIEDELTEKENQWREEQADKASDICVEV